MSENIERVQDRLGRIGSIQPVLAALRTIALASWRQALRQRIQVQEFLDQVERAAEHLPADVVREPVRRRPTARPDADPAAPVHRLVLVLGSERGLCGRFNQAAVERAELVLKQSLPAGSTIELAALGSRTGRLLTRRGLRPDWIGKLSLTAIPPLELALGLARAWLSKHASGQLDEVHLVLNDYTGLGAYKTVTEILIPPTALFVGDPGRQPPDPPVILETDAPSLRGRLVGMFVAAKLYEALIKSAAAEHSTRYQLMDGASQNANRIIDELTRAIQTARQQSITREMQELAVGAGLLGRRIS